MITEKDIGRLSKSELRTALRAALAELDQLRPRARGRPIAATAEEIKRVHALRAKGMSLRAISEKTGVSVRTARTILSGETK